MSSMVWTHAKLYNYVLLVQPCGHGGIFEKCVQQLYLCLTCFEVITKASVPLVQATTPINHVLHLKPFGLVQAFNSTIVPKVQCN